MIQDAKPCWWTQNFGVKLLLSQCTVDEFPIISVNWSWRMMMEKVFINFWWYIDKSLITQHLHLLLTKYPVFCWHHPCFQILYFLWSNQRSRGQLGKSFTIIDLYLYIYIYIERYDNNSNNSVHNKKKYWLVVEPTPLKKWWSSSVGIIVPNWMEQ